MKKFKLLTSLSTVTLVGGAVPIVVTACSSDTDYEIIVSSDVNYVGVSPEALRTKEDTIALPVPVMITKDGEQQTVTKVTASTDNTDIIKIIDPLPENLNTFRAIGLKEGDAKIKVEAETSDGHKESTTVNVKTKAYNDCGYLRFATWDEFFAPAESTTPAPFPYTGDVITITKNSTEEINNFLQTYTCAGMLSEGMYLAMYKYLLDKAVGTTAEEHTKEAVKELWDLNGGQMYWRKTDDAFEFMYGVDAKAKEKAPNPSYKVSWAAYGKMTKNGFQYDWTWTEGNRSEIDTYSSNKGPQLMSLYNGSETFMTNKTKYWIIDYYDESAPTGQNRFCVLIPYRDFGDGTLIELK